VHASTVVVVPGVCVVSAVAGGSRAVCQQLHVSQVGQPGVQTAATATTASILVVLVMVVLGRGRSRGEGEDVQAVAELPHEVHVSPADRPLQVLGARQEGVLLG
jgi:hypothetical protein